MSYLCQICANGAFYDHSGKKWSPGCTYSHAVEAGRRGLYTPRYVTAPAVQGQPLCQICDNAAYYDGHKYSPGCNRTHANLAHSQGLHNPRN